MVAPLKAPSMPAIAATTDPATAWLTYAELAERIGITGESARNLVRRKRWPRRPGNDGAQRVGVPLDYLAERDAEAPTHGDTIAPIEATTMEAMEATTAAAMEAHIATLRDMVTRAEETATHERQRADAAEVATKGERDRADRIAGELHDLAQRFAASTDTARLRESELAEKLDAVRQEAASLRSRPWWRRLAG